MKKLMLLSSLLFTGCAHTPTHEEAFYNWFDGQMKSHEVVCFQGTYVSEDHKHVVEKVIFHSYNAEQYWGPHMEAMVRDCKTGKEAQLQVHEPWSCFSNAKCEDK